MHLICAAALTMAGGFAMAQDLPYKEGSVMEVSFIKTKPGMFDAYMAWLFGDHKKEMEAMKKAGIITGYTVYAAQAHNPSDADVILTVTYKNMAALDNLDERTEAIDKEIFGSRDASNKAAISRESMREVLGAELIREMVSK
jgi:hypothetical protein